jgi:rRNA pseudouridine-1189 N-methylase Emg1 (Nep1/Mra1 family)
MMDFAANLGKDWKDGVNQPIVFAVGSHASGPANADWAERTLSFSKYPLSASVALSRLCYSFEHIWNVH